MKIFAVTEIKDISLLQQQKQRQRQKQKGDTSIKRKRGHFYKTLTRNFTAFTEGHE